MSHGCSKINVGTVMAREAFNKRRLLTGKLNLHLSACKVFGTEYGVLWSIIVMDTEMKPLFITK